MKDELHETLDIVNAFVHLGFSIIFLVMAFGAGILDIKFQDVEFLIYIALAILLLNQSWLILYTDKEENSQAVFRIGEKDGEEE